MLTTILCIIYEWLIENQNWQIIAILLAILIPLIIIAVISLKKFSNKPDKFISRDYQNSACGNQILQALRTFSQTFDMPFQTEEEDYKKIFNEGILEKEYYRDGKRYTIYFKIVKSKKECFLKLFKIKEYGLVSVTSSVYNSRIRLTDCRCR